MAYERTNIRKLHAYTPGEQPQSASVVKLNTNENPYPPAPQVMEAIRNVAADQLRRYPPPSATAFRETAAKVHGLSPDHVIATNGGDELLRLAITVFCDVVSGGNASGGTSGGAGGASGGTSGGLGESQPTYSLYDVLADIHDTAVARVPLREDWSLPDDFAAKLNDAGCRLVIVVNPHAPSGRLEPLDRLEAIARQLRGVLLIDEAYVDFADVDAVPLLDPARGLENVLLLRTLSKGYSLAGLRFGYGLGHPQLIAAMHKARDSYNVDIIAQSAAIAALSARDYARANWRKVIAERARLAAELVRRGFTVPPSQSNFLLAGCPGGDERGRFLYQSLKEKAIFVRYFDQDRLRDKLRITIGTPEQNNALLAELDRIAH